MQHLRASDDRLRALTRETTAFIYELDRDGRITFVNRPFAGLARERIEGTLLVDWFPAPLQPRIAAAVAAAIDAGVPQRLEYSTTDRKDRAHAYVTTITPIARDGVVASAALTAVDITELKAAEQKIVELNAGLERRVDERTAELQSAMERAESASRAKSEFLSRMSHELRTPLNAIIGFAQIIELSAPTPKQLQWAGAIRRAGDHLLQMIDDLLDLARIDIGKLAIRMEPVDLAPIVGESLAMVRPMMSARGLRLIEECHEALQVLADPLRLRQVVVNLLSNAVKYNREQGTVTIRCERRGDRVRLSVADTGIGIDAQKLHRLFQPFERLGAEARDVEGTGIGLALSKQLAALMGAQVGADSEPGVGSVFWIDVQGADPLSAEGPAQRAAQLSLGTASFDVLYVEDKVSNIDLIVAYLALYPNVRLRTALTGEAGLALARERRPDVVLLDIHLPGGMDGFQVLQAMRDDAQLRDLPVIALSADAMPRDIQRARAAGFARYIAKPVRLDELLRAFVAILADRPEAPAAP
jgi:PAS domain S-box-containing protein